MKKATQENNVERKGKRKKKWTKHLFYLFTWWVLKILQKKLEVNSIKNKKNSTDYTNFCNDSNFSLAITYKLLGY